jgi:hypothetical protein
LEGWFGFFLPETLAVGLGDFSALDKRQGATNFWRLWLSDNPTLIVLSDYHSNSSG